MNRLSTQEELILHTLQNKKLSALQIIQQILDDSGGEKKYEVVGLLSDNVFSREERVSGI